MGVHRLTKGQDRLPLELIGASEQALQAYMAGEDYVKLESAVTGKATPAGKR
jgi:hypothetical protein